MKQTNRAITFLIAQYRAIFKSAYLSGMTSAVALTAVLAAGQAQAAATDLDASNWKTALQSSDSLTINGEAGDAAEGIYTKLNIAPTTDEKLRLDKNQHFTITGAKAPADNAITAAAGKTVSLKGDGSLVIDAKTAGLTISAGADDGGNHSNASIDLNSVEIKNGKVTVNTTDAAGTATLASSFITIGGDKEGDEATVVLSGTGNNVLGGKSSSITIKGNGKVEAKGGNSNIQGALLTAEKDATLTFSGAGNKYSVQNSTLTSSNLTVEANGDLNIALENMGKDKQGSMTITGTEDAHGKVNVGGTLAITQGTVTVDKYVDLKATSANGKLVLGDQAAQAGYTNEGILRVGKDTLSGYLKDTTNKGSVELTSGGTLYITDEVDLKDLTFSGNASAGAIVQTNVSHGALGGSKLVISENIKNANTIAVKADNLVLGVKDVANSFETGVGSLETRNVEFLGKSFELKDGLTLRNVSINGDKVTANDGKITGNANINSAAGLTVDGGKYTYDASGSLTLTNGSLSVQNTKKADVSSLDFASGSKIIITGANAFNASASGDNAVLDISKATLEASGTGASPTTFKGESGGKVVISNAQLELVKNTSSAAPVKAVVFKADHEGTLAFSDAAVLNISATDASGGITIEDKTNAASGGTLDTTAGGLTIKNTEATPSYGVSGTLVTSSLTLHNNGTSDFTLKDGTYNITGGLTLVKTKDKDTTEEVTDHTIIVSGAGADADKKAIINLGGVAKAAGGAVSNLKVGADAEVNVTAGSWSGKDVTIEAGGGTFNVGTGTGDTLTSGSFSGKALSVAEANKFTVNNQSSATFETVSGGAAGAIAVKDFGSLTITGKEKSQDQAVKGVAGAVSIGKNASVTLGTEAIKKAVTKVSGDTVDFGTGFTDDLFTLGNNATFYIDLGVLAGEDKDKTISISANGLKTLKDKLFKDYNSATNPQLDGFINIGNTKIDGLTITDKKVTWASYKDFQDTVSGVTSKDLGEATVTGVDATGFKGAVGAVQLDNAAATLNVNGNTSFSNAKDNGGFFVSKSDGTAADISVSGDNYLTLNGGGKAGTITLKAGTADIKTNLIISGTSNKDEPITELTSITGEASGHTNTSVQITSKTKVTGEIKDIAELKVGSELEVTANVNVDDLSSLSSKGVSLKMTDKDLSAKTADFAGDITAKTATFSGNAADFAQKYEFDAKLGGNNEIGTLNLSGSSMINNGGTTKVTTKLDLASEKTLVVAEGATLDAKHINLLTAGGKTANLVVGQDSHVIKGNAGKDDISVSSSTGYLVANTIKLNSGSLIADPSFGAAATIIAVSGFGDSGLDVTKTAGTIDGKGISLQNSILAIGVEKNDKTISDLQEQFKNYLDPKTGSLSADGVGSILYVAKHLDLQTSAPAGGTAPTAQIIVDSKRGLDQYNTDSTTAGNNYKAIIEGNDAYIGENSALAVSADAAINDFDATGAQKSAITFNKTTASVYAEKNSSVLLTGEFSSSDNIKLFENKNGGTTSGVKINGNDLKVTTFSGIYEYVMKEGEPTVDAGFTLNVNKDKLNDSYRDASFPSRNTLVAYAKKELANGDRLHGEAVAGVTYDETANQYKKGGTALTAAESKNYMHVGDKVYTKVNNRFLENLTQNSNSGRDVDTITRLGAYSGMAHAAVAAGNSTASAVAARFAIGSTPVDFVAAHNNMGGSVYVAPFFSNSESDGFDSEGVSYGVDVDTNSVAIGADYEFTPQIRAGIMANLGTGSTEGKGQASSASTDFDFYSVAVYAGYTNDRLSVVGDLSYTMIDNEVKAFVTDSTLKTNADSSNISLGVNAQYTLDVGQTAVTPHMGLRYSMIDADGYSVDTAGSFDSDDINVISIPVGVTIAQAYASDNWIVTPSADFTVTGNFGDDSYKGSFKWSNVSNLTTSTETEILDSMTYGVTLGLNAETGNMGMGLGLNYTKSSNTDAWGFGATCRYLF